MKKILLVILIVPVLFSSCNKCGEDVFLGEYALENQSKQNWYPYLGTDQLLFENTDGETIELTVSNRKEQFETLTFRDICRGNKPDDVAREIYKAERYVVEYNGLADDITYFLKISLLVNRFAIAGNTDYFNLYDEVNYSSSIQDYSSANNQRITADIKLVADPRDTEIQNVNIWHDGIAHHADQLTLNGKNFTNVWYFESDNIPTLYAQKGAGIIAFLGFNDEVWVKQ